MVSAEPERAERRAAIGAAFRRAREAQQQSRPLVYSQEAVGRRFRTPKTYGKWERGDTMPRVDDALDLLVFLGLGVEALDATRPRRTHLGQLLRRSREAHGWSVGEASRRAGLPAPMVESWEMGTTRTVPLTVFGLARELGLAADEIAAAALGDLARLGGFLGGDESEAAQRVRRVAERGRVGGNARGAGA